MKSFKPLASFKTPVATTVAVLVLVVGVFSLTLSRAASALAFQPAADARIQQSLPSSNFGSATKLWAGGGHESYLNFKVAGLDGPHSAKLRLYVLSATPDRVFIEPAITCWQEQNITWSTNPGHSNTGLKSVVPNQANTWVEIPLGNLDNGMAGFALTGSGINLAKFASREDAHAPQLVFDGQTDTQGPEVQLIQPASGSTASGTVNLLATAVDNIGVTKLEFFRDGVLLGLGQATPEGYTLTWNTQNTPNGNYMLKARASDASGNQTTVKYLVSINNLVSPSEKPGTGFSSGQASFEAPANVSFGDASTNTPTQWLWNFGDGTTSIKSNPSHVFAQPGVYLVSLTASNSRGSTTVTQNLQVTEYNRPGRLPGATRILLMGDSITGQYCRNAQPTLVSGGYNLQVISDPGIGLLSANPDEIAKIQSYVTNFDPDKIVIEHIGNYINTNSIQPTLIMNTKPYLAAWQQRADQASQIGHSRGASVWWMDSPPISSLAPQGKSSDEIRAGYHALYAAHPTLSYIDAYYPFGGPTPIWSLRTSDGVHLNASGSAWMAGLVTTALKAPQPDLLSPSAPTVSASLNSSNQVVLSWSRSIDTGSSGLVGYKIYRNNQPTPIANSTDPAALTFTDATPGTGNNSYVVAGYDGDGNVAASSPVSIVVP